MTWIYHLPLLITDKTDHVLSVHDTEMSVSRSKFMTETVNVQGTGTHLMERGGVKGVDVLPLDRVSRQI